jgi:hypothetical protein
MEVVMIKQLCWVLALSLTTGLGALAQNVGPTETFGPNGATNQDLALTGAQKHAIYNEVIRDKSKSARVEVPTTVGADVPPSIELYNLPDDATADNPPARLYKFTVVQDRVVVVDPTKMQVVEVIEPSSGR